ncbi:MAG: GNAT family N-acetyltransferase, partial [Candidatus Roizmanbacteria bacterium]|nr:GNAT family N-acetyltransferase [Candidatus Roizmanbacteria bacterium]
EFPGYTPQVVQYLLNRIYTREAFKYWIKRKEKIIIGAYEKDSVVGFAVIDAPYGGVSFCRWLGVLKKHQHKGFGTALIQKWNELALESKAHKMEVAGQPEAKVFYEKMGFHLEGFRKKSYFGIDQHLFGKVLGSPDVTVMTK